MTASVRWQICGADNFAGAVLKERETIMKNQKEKGEVINAERNGIGVRKDVMIFTS